MGLGLGLVLVITDNIVQICVHLQILRMFFMCPRFCNNNNNNNNNTTIYKVP